MTHPAAMKKKIDIEELLAWTYTHELRKQPVGGLTRDEQMMYLGTIVDERPDYGTMLPVALGPPHADAVLVARRVAALPPMPIQWPRARAILAPDVGAYLADDEASLRGLVVDPAKCIEVAAMGERRPDWGDDQISFSRSIGANGKPRLFGPDGGPGLTPGNRYVDGAHCPLELDFTPAVMVRERFIYLAWHMAMTMLANENWNLIDHIPLPPSAPKAPWLSAPPKKPHIWPTTAPARNTYAQAAPLTA